jgi:hypothetical protein
MKLLNEKASSGGSLGSSGSWREDECHGHGKGSLLLLLLLEDFPTLRGRVIFMSWVLPSFISELYPREPALFLLVVLTPTSLSVGSMGWRLPDVEDEGSGMRLGTSRLLLGGL